MSKYHAVRTGGYASKREATFASALHALNERGIISGLREQVKYELVPGRDGVRGVTYIADFVYEEQGKTVVADAKGFRTPVYKLKKRLMFLLKGIEILEL